MANNHLVYVLIDKSLILSNIYESVDASQTFHEYLCHLNKELSTLSRLNVSIDANKLRFDHLFIYVTTSVHKNDHKYFPLEYDRIVLDFNTFTFKSTESNNYSHVVQCNTPVSKLLNEVKSTYNKVVKNTTNNTNRHTTRNVKRKVTFVKKDNALNTSTNVQNNTNERLIPTILSSEDSLSYTEEEEQLNEVGLPRPFNTVLSNDLESVEQQLNELKKLKEQESKKLDELKNDLESDLNNFSKYSNELNDEKRFLRKDKEREEEKQRRFSSDKRTYLLIKDDIEQGKLTEDNIPPLFSEQYPILKYMYEKELFNTDGNYYLYTELYNGLYKKNDVNKSSDTYVPHNINYLDEEEREKYESVNSKHKDDIEEFIENNNKKQYRSLDDILNDLSTDSSESSDYDDLPHVDDFNNTDNTEDEQVLQQLANTVNNN